MNKFASEPLKYGQFIIRNVTPDRQKSIKIFGLLIPYGKAKNLLEIPGISESEIRASLLKGELQHKIRVKDIIVEFSDIDLLQFNEDHKKFLQKSGIYKGVNISYDNFDVGRREDIVLIGLVNNQNNIFKTSEIFIQNSLFKIIVYLNGIKQAFLDDYIIAENMGPDTGYNTVIFTIPPNFESLVTADYYVQN